MPGTSATFVPIIINRLKYKVCLFNIYLKNGGLTANEMAHFEKIEINGRCDNL